jgi:acetyl-CoA carboxylase, biotin carboxylase subunit
LEEYRIGGIHTTIPFHQQVMDLPRFQGGQFDTGFVDGPDGFRLADSPSKDLSRVAAIVAALLEHEKGQQAVILGSSAGSQAKAVSSWKQAGRPGGSRR